MQIFERLCDRLKKQFSLLFLHAVLRAGKQVVVKRVGTAILLNEINFAAALNDIDELGYDWVVELCKDVHLSF